MDRRLLPLAEKAQRMRIKLSQLAELADRMNGASAGLGDVIDLVETRPGEYARREPAAAVLARLRARIAEAEKELARWQRR